MKFRAQLVYIEKPNEFLQAEFKFRISDSKSINLEDFIKLLAGRYVEITMDPLS